MPPKHSIIDPDWTPQAGDLTWTRIDKSTTRALGMIIRLPINQESTLLNKDAVLQNVYCDQDSPDRYSIACLTRHGDQDSHVYVPRHYMKTFDLKSALSLKCMKTKPKDVRDLTPWDRDKRHSIKVVQKWLDDKTAHNLDSVHHFVECPECCDEASDDFWKAVNLQRGDAHIKRRESLEKRRQMIKEECQERDQLLKDRQAKASAAVAKPVDNSGEEKSGEEEDEDDDDDKDDDESSTDESRDNSSDGAAGEDEDDDDVSDDRESSFEEDAISEDDDDDDNASSVSSAAAATAPRATKKSAGNKIARASPSTKKRRTNAKKYFLASPSSSEGTEAEDGGGGGGGGGTSNNSGNLSKKTNKETS